MYIHTCMCVYDLAVSRHCILLSRFPLKPRIITIQCVWRVYLLPCTSWPRVLCTAVPSAAPRGSASCGAAGAWDAAAWERAMC